MESCRAMSCFSLIALLSLCSAASIKSRNPPCRAESSRKMNASFPLYDEDDYYKSLQRTPKGFLCYTSNGTRVNYNNNVTEPCESLKRCVRSNQRRGARDDELVRCDEKGLFEKIQETDHWEVCVDVHEGQEIVCKGDAPCRAERERMENDVDFPQCDEHGFYKSLQRMAEGFFCYTSNGIPINYTFEKYYNALRPCDSLKECVKSNEVGGAKDHELIKCDEHGFFKQLQKTECWKVHVDVYGGTLSAITIPTAKLPPLSTDLYGRT